ncbi:universal stress protein [Arthrobacter cupressi]|uniref:universal stress protein n=1 Tax=Arthrobacter cupressi TaxID=1045773 RepID=UPI00111333D4|nr:universal stress protein [Arthrobacter cupressi]NYD79701.1 nucleotide-binding universal stress UspA family protein [Arthrobacter cupressi]
MGRILVGFDGSPASATAVRWAARQALLRKADLAVIHCSMWPAVTHDLAPVPGIADSGLRHAAEAVLAEGAVIARDESPDVAVSTVLKYGWPAVLLRDASAGADMLVVGSRGIGGFMGLLVGSVSLELAATADCPVAVIRETEHPGGAVVVGIDALRFGSAPASKRLWEEVARQACVLATLTESPLQIVYVQPRHGVWHRSTAPTGPHRPEDLLEDIARTVRRWSPALEVSTRILAGTSAAGTLLEASRAAGTVVVGTHGHGVVRASVGSTAHAVLHHAQCPVLVVRPAGAAAGD